MDLEQMDRRRFLENSALATAGLSVVPRRVLGGTGHQAPSDTLNVAGIGVGGRGTSNMNALTSENIVAICDIDYDRVDQSLRDDEGNISKGYQALHTAYEQAERYADYRVMLDEMGDQIDAVVISTPDHLHAVAAQRAMEMGKHVYVEKPLTRTIREARILRETAERTNVVTQMGNQGHTHPDGRRAIEWVWAGAIGAVHEIHAWTDRPMGWWPQGMDRPDASMSPPSDLEWDLFLGPAPEVPYHEAYHPFKWRGWTDYGTGALGDMGAHLIDHAYWALDLGPPTEVWGSSTPFGKEGDTQVSWPTATTVQYEFARGGREPVRLMWYDGGLLPPRPRALPDEVPLVREADSFPPPSWGGGILVGEDGILMYDTYGRNPRLYPTELEKEYRDAPKALPRIEASHQMNWANACKGQAEASCPFEYAVPLTETMLLGVVSLQAGRPIRYDQQSMEISSAPGAEQYLRRDYRDGWSL
ncbi:MAG: Gfo/Idh/MocA family protein [Salinibacter sp.]